MSVGLPWLSNVIDQPSAVAVQYFRLQQMWQLLRLRVCDVFNVFEVRKRVQGFHRMFVSVEFTMLRGFNVVGHVANSQIPLACSLEVFMMV